MTLPAFGAAGTGTVNGTAATQSVAYPAGITAGQLLIIHYWRRTGTAIGLTIPAGWELITEQTGSSMRSWILGKIATGNESGSVSLTSGASSAQTMIRMYRFTNAAGYLVEDFEGITITNGGPTTSIAMPTVTTTGGDRLAIAFVGINDDGRAPGSATGESGGDWTESVAEINGASNSGGCIQIQTADMATAGSISGGVTTIASGENYLVVGLAAIGSSQPKVSGAFDANGILKVTDIPATFTADAEIVDRLYIGDRGFGANTTASNSLTVDGRTSTIAAGSWGVLCIATDNAGTNSGEDPMHPVSATDSKGNLWTRRQNHIFDGGVANTGYEFSFYTSPITTDLLTTDTLSFSWISGVSSTAEAWTWYEVKPARGATVIYITSNNIAGGTAANVSVTTDALSVGQGLIGANFLEGTHAVTPDSDTTNGVWSRQQTAASGGVTTNAMRIASQSKLQTTTASTQTYNVVHSSADRGAAWIVFDEIGIQFTADAVLSVLQTGTFSADAILQTIVSDDFTADAVLDGGISGSEATFTANAVLLSSVVEDFTADAVVLSSVSDDFTANSVLKGQGSGSFTANAIIKSTLSNALTGDAVILITASDDFLSDAVIFRTYVSTFSGDSIIGGGSTGDFTADAVIQTVVTEAFTANALIVTIIQVGFSADAVLSTTIPDTFTADAAISVETISQFSAFAILVVTSFVGTAEVTGQQDRLILTQGRAGVNLRPAGSTVQLQKVDN